MSFYQNYTFKTGGGNLTGVADFTAAAVGTVFEKKSGELFTKNTQGLFEKTARSVPSMVDVNATVTAHETNTIYHKQNMSTTIDPSVTSDSSVGYSIGSIWINTSTNTAFTCTDVTVGAAQWTSGYVPPAAVASIPLSQKGAASGVATLGIDGNLLKGLKAFNGKNVQLATNTDLGALPLATSSGFYDVQYTAAGTVASRRGLPLGWYHLEIQRHSSDVSGSRFYTVRASALNLVTTGDIWTLSVQAGVVTNFTKQSAIAQARADAAFNLASGSAAPVVHDVSAARALGVSYYPGGVSAQGICVVTIAGTITTPGLTWTPRLNVYPNLNPTDSFYNNPVEVKPIDMHYTYINTTSGSFSGSFVVTAQQNYSLYGYDINKVRIVNQAQLAMTYTTFTETY